jgi:hypothetical protein
LFPTNVAPSISGGMMTCRCTVEQDESTNPLIASPAKIAIARNFLPGLSIYFMARQLAIRFGKLTRRNDERFFAKIKSAGFAIIYP